VVKSFEWDAKENGSAKLSSDHEHLLKWLVNPFQESEKNGEKEQKKGESSSLNSVAKVIQNIWEKHPYLASAVLAILAAEISSRVVGAEQTSAFFQEAAEQLTLRAFDVLGLVGSGGALVIQGSSGMMQHTLAVIGSTAYGCATGVAVKVASAAGIVLQNVALTGISLLSSWGIPAIAATMLFKTIYR
jgi:hypothetical protein